jgi:hypothetical protein
MKTPKVLFLSSKEALPILEELALLVTSPPDKPWAISYLWTTDVFEPGKSFLECLLDKAKGMDFAVILVSPDDQANIRGTSCPVPRDNVIFEAGLYIAARGPAAAVLVVESRESANGRLTPKLPSDLAGIVHFDFILPSGYDALPEAERNNVLRASLNPVKKRIKTHLLSQPIKSNVVTLPPSPDLPHEAIGLRTSGRIIPLYYDLEDEHNWFREMEGYLQSTKVVLPSELTYYGPGLAYQWIGVANGGPGNEAQTRAFERAISDILRNHVNTTTRNSPLTLVDLGIGNFFKGEKIIQEMMAQRQQGKLNLRYVAYDISFEMICTALGVNSGRNATVETLKLPGNDILGITAPFEKLKNYKDVIGTNECLFLLLGNTLGNELNEEQTLRSISEVMKAGDKLLIEVQLMEDKPIPVEVIAGNFRKDIQFYAGPLLAFGCPEDNISLQVVPDFGPKGGMKCWTYSCECSIANSVERYVAPIKKKVTYGGGDTVVTTYIVRKYSESALDSMIHKAKLKVIDKLKSPSLGEYKRQFQYIVAERI